MYPQVLVNAVEAAAVLEFALERPIFYPPFHRERSRKKLGDTLMEEAFMKI